MHCGYVNYKAFPDYPDRIVFRDRIAQENTTYRVHTVQIVQVNITDVAALEKVCMPIAYHVRIVQVNFTVVAAFAKMYICSLLIVAALCR